MESRSSTLSNPAQRRAASDGVAFEEDYTILKESCLVYEEDEPQRFLVIKNFPLTSGLYSHGGTSLDQVEVLCVIPANYNTSGGDMFWVHPPLVRADGKTIPNAAGFGGPEPQHSKARSTVAGHAIGRPRAGSRKLIISRRFSIASNGL